MTRRGVAALLALALMVGLCAVPAGAGTTGPAGNPDPRIGHPRVVGGVESSPGQWPWQVAILDAKIANSYNAFFCGGTVISRSWVMTAAHCVFNPQTGAQSLPSDIDVLTSTNVLGNGSGARIHVATIKVNPNWDDATSQNDVALVRLATPTSAAAVPLVTASQGSLWSPGTVATVSGWGNTSADPNAGQAIYPARLRHATVPIQADSTCAQKYPPGRTDPVYGDSLTFYVASMMCAGPLAGGRDTCNGDSGGPLVVPGPGGAGWVQVGITSWGYGCAQPDNPGVYSRLGASSMAGFVALTKRFGPFDDSTAFIVRQFVDFEGRWPTAAELAAWQDRLSHDPARDLILAVETSPTWQDHGWAVVRLFRAVFSRDPDTSGLSYWTRRSLAGTPLRSVASSFAGSAEFANRYGSLDNGSFVDLVYQNVLGRQPDAAGRNYWISRLSAGLTRGSMMVGFSEGSEYRAATYSRVRAITTWYGLLRKAPSTTQTNSIQTEPIATLIDSLRASFSYALRF